MSGSRTPLKIDNSAAPRTLQIGSLAVRGFTSTSGVANFLNVPYAQIPARFKAAQLLDPTVLEGELDARYYGPRCPQPIDPIHIIMHNMFEVQSMEQYSSEFDCLHLNIYAPADFEQRAEKLPVFAYIHGGAFNCGDNTTEFDGNHLVKRSVELGKPIILVAINYRVNVLGFLGSRELDAKAASVSEPAARNLGLYDQRLALQWIQSFVHLFGGDRSRVTLSGESAGAASVVFHLQGSEALFRQAIIQSTPLPRVRSLDESQAVFDKLVRASGIETTAPAAVKLAAVRSLSVESLIDAAGISGPSFPVEDPAWFTHWDPEAAQTVEFWATVPAWCTRIIIGHTKDEGALFFIPPLANTTLSTERLEKIIAALHPDPSTVSVLMNSQLFRSAASPLHALVDYGTRCIFQQPVMDLGAFMATQSKTVYVYGINTVDPFPGSLQGFSWHSFGIPIMFYQPACQKYKELAITADRMSEIYLGFFYGEEPWEPHSTAGRKWSWKGEESGLVEKEDLTDEALVRLEGNPELQNVYQHRCQRLLESVLGSLGHT